MDKKTGIIIVGTFAAGLGIGYAVGHMITKKDCEQRQQESVNDIADVYRKRLKKMKEELEAANEKKKEESEEEIDITDFVEEESGVDNSSNNSSDNVTRFDYSKLKETIKKVKAEESEDDSVNKSWAGTMGKIFEGNDMVSIDHKTMQLLSEEPYNFYTKDFSFYVDEEEWRDYDSDAPYEIEDLPFDPHLVEWDENEMCYIAEKSNHSIYVLDKRA